MRNVKPIELELLSVIGKGAAREKYYSHPLHHMLWEEKVAIPMLGYFGYKPADTRNPHFYNKDYMRVIEVEKDGVLYCMWYSIGR